MARYVTGFVVADIVLIHRAFNDAIADWARTAAAAPDPFTRNQARRVERQLLLAYRQTNAELNQLAAAGAADARKRMRERFDKTAKRRNTQVRPHLRAAIDAKALIISRGLGTGAVGVADIGKLDKVVNPISPAAGPYWMAQEKGSPKMKGRVIRGYFFGPGYSGGEVPRGQYKGGGGPHPIFVSAKAASGLYSDIGFDGGGGAQGGRGGFGTIEHPIKARWFIRDGAALARRDWLIGLQRIETQSIVRLRAATVVGAAAGSGRRRRR